MNVLHARLRHADRLAVIVGMLLMTAGAARAVADDADARPELRVDPLGQPHDVAPLIRRAPQPAPRMAGTADVGDIAVIEDDGTLVVGLQTNTTNIVNAFYETHGDEYDQLIIHVSSGYLGDVDPEAGFAFFQIAAGFTGGIGRSQGNPNVDDGLTRLGGWANMNDLPEYPPDPTEDFFGNNHASYVEIFGQEFGHQWLAFVQPHPSTGADILGRGEAHWSFFLHHPGVGNASPMEGNRWLPVIGGYLSIESFTGYAEIDEYIMGLRAPADVSPFYVIAFDDSPPFSDSRFPQEQVMLTDGFPIDLTVQDIIDNHGPRGPDTRFSMKRLRAAFILVTPPGAPIDDDLQKLDVFREAARTYFNETTEGAGTLITTLGPGPAVDPAVFAAPDSFESGVFDDNRYEYYQGVTIDDGGLDEPTGTKSMRLNGNWGGGDQIRSHPFDLSATPSGHALLRYVVQKTGSGDGPEDDEDLVIEYSSSGDDWIELQRLPAAGRGQAEFTAYRRVIPDDGMHGKSRFRFRRGPGLVGPNGDWFVDDVALSIGPPCFADLTGDGAVDAFDLFELLSRWGTDGVGADIDTPIDLLDGRDVAALLAAWGPCPSS